MAIYYIVIISKFLQGLCIRFLPTFPPSSPKTLSIPHFDQAPQVFLLFFQYGLISTPGSLQLPLTLSEMVFPQILNGWLLITKAKLPLLLESILYHFLLVWILGGAVGIFNSMLFPCSYKNPERLNSLYICVCLIVFKLFINC